MMNALRNERNETTESKIILWAIIIMTTLSQGCISLQIPSADGKPKLFGFGSAKAINCIKGQIYQLTAPGISLRVDSSAPGVSLGWHQTKFFFPSNNISNSSTNRPIAIQNKCIGVNLSHFGF